MCPWETCYPYRYYEEVEFQFPKPVRHHTIWRDVDYLAQRVAVLEQKVSKLEGKPVESKVDKQ